MLIKVCVSKIHRATVTQAELNYVGSITIDKVLMQKAGIKPYQMVNVNNISNGVHWETYALEGPAYKGGICLNGPPARNFHPGDLVVIVADAYIEPKEYKKINPVVVFVDAKNKITKVVKHKTIDHTRG